MSQKSIELRRERDGKLQRMKALQKSAQDSKRDLSEGEETEFNALNDQISEMKKVIDKEEAPELRSRRLAELEAEMAETPAARGKGSPEAERNASPVATPEYRNAFWGAGMRKKPQEFTPEESRALSVGSAADGGLTVPSATLEALQPIIRVANVMRDLASVRESALDIAIPIQSGKAITYHRNEGKPATADTGIKVKGELLRPNGFTTEVLISNELLKDSAENVEAFVVAEMGLSAGETEEVDFIVGDGVEKPTGILTQATDSGITFASATTPTPDELFDVDHALPRQYRKNAKWLMSDAMVKLIRKFKATTNQYIGLWQNGMEAGAPDLLLGKPVFVSDNIPAPTGSNKAMLLGDFSHYWIMDRTGRTFQRLVELYALTGQVAILMNFRTDGNLIRKDAVVFATMHS